MADDDLPDYSGDDQPLHDPFGDTASDVLPESGPGSLAPVWARGLARAIDMFIVFMAGGVIARITGLVNVVDDEVVSTNPTLAILVLLGFWAVYEVAGTAGGGRTFGKVMLGLRVRAAEADRSPLPSKAMVRWLLPAIALLLPIGEYTIFVLMLVYLSGALHPRYQGFHDRVANTLVVRAR
jgi:uncharacterized RDD family membrane protein YckC